MPRHLALVPAFPEPVALLPPLPPLEFVLPAVVWIYQHTNDPPPRRRARRCRRTHHYQLLLPMLVPPERSKPKSLGAGRKLTPEERRQGHRLRRRLDLIRPKTRDDCKDSVRPCPWVSCKMNLFLDVKGRSIKLNFPHLEPHQMADSCVLDITDKYPDGITLERVGRKTNLTMERVRQVEEAALEKVKDSVYVDPPDDYEED